MSDESVETAQEVGLAPLEDRDGRSTDVVVPSLAGRIEGVHGSISTLGMRIDALVSSTTSYRSSLTDRLSEYSDLVVRLTRTQASDLEEYRRASERNLQDLRRSLAANEQLLEQLSSRIEEAATDGEQSDQATRKVLGEVRALFESQEHLGRFVTSSLDQFADQVLGRVGEAQGELVAGLDAVRSALAASQAATDDLAERVAAPALRQAVDELRADVQSLRRSILEWPELVRTTEQVQGLRGEVTGLLERLAGDDSAAAQAAVRSELAAIRSRLESGDDELVRDALVAIRGRLDSAATADDLRALHDQIEALDPAASLRSTLDALEARVRQIADRDPVPPLAMRIDALAAGLEAMWADSAVRDEITGLREHLSDVASGEVVAGLWDGVHVVQTSIRELQASLGELGAEVGAIRAGQSDDGADVQTELRDTLGSLRHQAAADASARAALADRFSDAVGELKEMLREGMPDASMWAELADGLSAAMTELGELVRSRPTERPADDADADAIPQLVEQLSFVQAEVASLHAELAQGLVVQPSDEMTELRDEMAALRSQLATPAPEADTATLQPGFDAVAAQLSLLADDLGSIRSLAPDEAGVGSAVADQFAALRDELRTELDGLRSALAMGPGAEALDQVRQELTALRRRIAVRAGQDGLTDEQLATLADAIAARLSGPEPRARPATKSVPKPAVKPARKSAR